MPYLQTVTTIEDAMRLHIISWILTCFVATATGAQTADRAPVLLELFTSQGCSSCPPADVLFADLAKNDGIVALAFHVDYWDYLGWKDQFGSRQFSRRQRGYAMAARDGAPYTPQMIVNGTHRAIGSHAAKVAQAITNGMQDQGTIRLTADRSGGAYRVTASPMEGAPNHQIVQIAHVSPGETVTISGGENAGHSITYVNVVQALDTVAEWDGTAPLVFDVTLRPGTHAVVITQDAPHGAVRGVLRLSQ